MGNLKCSPRILRHRFDPKKVIGICSTWAHEQILHQAGSGLFLLWGYFRKSRKLYLSDMKSSRYGNVPSNRKNPAKISWNDDIVDVRSIEVRTLPFPTLILHGEEEWVCSSLLLGVDELRVPMVRSRDGGSLSTKRDPHVVVSWDHESYAPEN